MSAATLQSSPFKNLKELYDNLDTLQVWPQITDLRESTEYVFRGLDLQDIRLRKVYREEQPRTLVCHDMKGGYLEDRFIDGSTANDSYIFYHWSVIDTFVYFSHNFITIPPYGWINAAHSHGVKVLGTIITEGSGGTKEWDQILESRAAVTRFADALVQIAKFYKFEGWLLNVENGIDKSNIDNLIYFIRYLTSSIHDEIEASEVIWYDSVTNKGSLSWQNELNNENKEFFFNCDGIYLNYNWTDSKLTNSCSVATNSGRDIKDIYVGLDVWGRGCPGGGGFNSVHALEKIRAQGLSVAIFAPAWTHEYFGPTTFHQLEDIFWAQLIPYLYIHVPIYDNEAFDTSFCRGRGSNYYKRGTDLIHCSPDIPAWYRNILHTMTATSDDNELMERTKCALIGKPFFNLTVQRPQISVPVPHLRFTRASKRNKPNDDNTEVVKRVIENIYETQQSVMHITGNIVEFEYKLSAPSINYFQFYDRFSYEGGGCLKLVTGSPMSYHRLFLVHVDFNEPIQARLIYDVEEDENGEKPRIEPILILGNDGRLKKILPCAASVMLTSTWRECKYLTNVRCANEIGVTFPRNGVCYLGEIRLQLRNQYDDNQLSPEFVASLVSDYEEGDQ